MKQRRDTTSTVLHLGWYTEAETICTAHRLVILTGPPGCGKTTFINEFALGFTGHPAEMFQATSETESPELWGRYVLVAGETRFTDGPVPRALKTAGVLCINDVHALPPELRGTLLELREDFVTNPVSGERLQVPAKFRLIASSNGEAISRCRGSDIVLQAFIDDCLLLEIAEPTTEQVMNLLKHNFPAANADLLDVTMEKWEKHHEPPASVENPRKQKLSYRAAAHLLKLLLADIPLQRAVEVALINKYVLDVDLHTAMKLRSNLE